MKEKIFAGLLFLTWTVLSAQVPEDSVHTKVEIEATFPGGATIWRNYLTRSLNGDVAAENHAPPGTYTVVVQFIVNKDGMITDIKPLTNHGFGMEDEVIRVIGKGPKWNPAIQDGKQVKAYRKQPVTFQVMTDFELSTYTLTVGKINIIEITSDQYKLKAEDIEVTLSYGTITYDSGNKYIITVDKPGRILLSIKNRAKKKKDEYDYGTVALEVK
jgi:Gram-negative bacterial TonB protein C-terminal